eukprot:858553-Prorocentrum_lima.AAC.1
MDCSEGSSFTYPMREALAQDPLRSLFSGGSSPLVVAPAPNGAASAERTIGWIGLLAVPAGLPNGVPAPGNPPPTRPPRQPPSRHHLHSTVPPHRGQPPHCPPRP